MSDDKANELISLVTLAANTLSDQLKEILIRLNSIDARLADVQTNRSQFYVTRR